MMDDKEVKILFGNGADWSKASVDIEGIFNSWLKQSGIKEEEFFKRINSETFEVTFSQNKIVLSDKKGEIGLSLIYDGNEDYNNFLTDAAFFLMYISYKSDSHIFAEKMKLFVKNNILTNIIK